MRIILFFMLIGLFSGYSQDYSHIDKKVKNYPEFPNLDVLVIRVNNDFSSEEDRVRAFYIWIATHVKYNLKAYYGIRNRLPAPLTYKKTDLESERDRELRIAKGVFERRETLCEGYSLLFKELCTRSKIEARVIKGITRTNARDIKKVRRQKDHAWNAVKVNGEWKLVDLTWSTGFEDSGTGIWVQRLNDFYFFTPPEAFITSHFPQYESWQLVDEKITLDEFFAGPIFYPKYFESDLRLKDDSNGVIQLSEGANKVSIVFDSNGSRPQLHYAFPDDRYLKHLRVRKDSSTEYRAIYYHYQSYPETLTVYLGTDPIVDFKVKR